MTGFVVLSIVVTLAVLAIVFWVWIWWRVFEKAGYHGALGVLMIIPIANAVMATFLSLSKWPIHEQMEAAGLAPVKSSKPLPKLWIVLALVLSLLPVLAMFSAIVIPNIVRAKMSANEALAKSTMRVILTAAENYAVGHEGKYPPSEDALRVENYVPATYDHQAVSGYSYRVEMSAEGYAITAQPVTCLSTGSKIFKVKDGGNLEQTPCIPVDDGKAYLGSQNDKQ